MRVEHTESARQVTVVKRSDFDKDSLHGYVCFIFNPERDHVVIDRITGRSHTTKLLADIGYRCVECQFDTLDVKLMQKHRAEGPHLWDYGPFDNPYGHCSTVVIEGIEDYAAFMANKENKHVDRS